MCSERLGYASNLRLWLVISLMVFAPSIMAEGIGSPSEPSLDNQAEMVRLMAIAKKAQPAARPYSGTLDIEGHPALGRYDAPLVLVEFGSYQCPYCRRHFLDTMPGIKSTYIATGRLRYVFFDFALDPRHEHAAKAAEAAHCAHEQNSFWDFRGQLFRNSKALAPELLAAHARSVGMDEVAFAACLESGRHAAKPIADRALSRKFRIRGTPSFFLARPDGEDGRRLTLVRRISGARSMEFFAGQLDPLYKESEGLEQTAAGMTGEKPKIE